MVYIQYKAYGTLETIDSFSTYKEAKAMLAEYRLSFSGGYLYLSKRATKAWRDNKLNRISQLIIIKE